MTEPMEQRRRKVLAALILDASGSMAGTREATISGVNEWVEDQKRVTDTDMELLFVPFSTDVHDMVGPKPIAEFAGISHREYIPDGWTALFDAVGSAIRTMESHEADSYLVLIVTDGQENRSQEFRDVAKIRERIQACEALGNWTFVFLGASADAWGGGATMGVMHTNSAQNRGQYDDSSARRMFAGLRSDTTAYRSQVAMGEARSVNFAVNTSAALDDQVNARVNNVISTHNAEDDASGGGNQP